MFQDGGGTQNLWHQRLLLHDTSDEMSTHIKINVDICHGLKVLKNKSSTIKGIKNLSQGNLSTKVNSIGLIIPYTHFPPPSLKDEGKPSFLVNLYGIIKF